MKTSTSSTPAPRHGVIGPRLRRVEGQIRGITRMVDEDKPCRDILIQVSAAREALRKAALILVEDHLKTCVRSPEAAAEMLDILHAMKP
jgi:DNA-binding FrmR family transcriptional regulator